MEKTVVIWDGFGEQMHKYFVLDGDYSIWNGVYVGTIGNEDVQENIAYIMWNANGEHRQQEYKEFPVDMIQQNPNTKFYVVQTGIIP